MGVAGVSHKYTNIGLQCCINVGKFELRLTGETVRTNYRHVGGEQGIVTPVNLPSLLCEPLVDE